MIKRNSKSAKEYLGKTVLFMTQNPVHEKIDGRYIVTGYENKPAKFQGVKLVGKSAYTWVKSKRPIDFDATVIQDKIEDKIQDKIQDKIEVS